MARYLTHNLSKGIGISAIALLLSACSGADSAQETTQTLRECDGCPDMVLIPGGSFEMGRDAGEPGRYDGPIRPVTIKTSFYLATTEVTHGQYSAFVKETGYEPVDSCFIFLGEGWGRADWANWESPGLPDAPQESDPVVCVSWDDATAYVDWLAKRTGQPYRLPTEAEWEYAARAGTTGDFPWGGGSNDGCAVANMYDMKGDEELPEYPWAHAECNDGFGAESPVASLEPNSFGLYDILGNVWEWTQDCYVLPYPEDGPRDGTAVEVDGDCERRTVRGGSWQTRPSRFAVAWRGRDAPAEGFGTFGLRVARSITAED